LRWRIFSLGYVSADEMSLLPYQLRHELIEFIRRPLVLQKRWLRQDDFILFDHLLNPDAPAIGFARCSATCQRVPLKLQQMKNELL